MATAQEVLEGHASRGRVLLPMDEISLVDAQHLGLLINYAPRKRQVNISESISYPKGSYGEHLQELSLKGRRNVLQIIMQTNPDVGENVVNIDYNQDMEEDMFFKSWLVLQLENCGYEVNDDALSECLVLHRPEWD